MSKKTCSICLSPELRDDAPVISLGFGEPRLICNECEADFETATTSRDYDEIAAAMDRIGTKLSRTNADRGTFKAVNAILTPATERAKAILDGTYDFALDEADDSVMDEIPEELRETEEDKALDAEDEEKKAVFDKIFNYFAIGAIGAVVLFGIWRILDIFVF